MSTVQNNQSSNQPYREPLRIVVDEPEEFKGILRSDITTTERLSKKVNRLFNAVFNDYIGCSIVPNQFGTLQLSLFFKDNGLKGDKYNAFVPVGTAISKNSGIIQKIDIMSRRQSSRKYEMTPEARELLSEFFMIPNNQKEVNWNQVTLEEVEPNNMGMIIYNKIINMDLNRVVKKIFGGKVEGSRVDYQIIPMKPISTGIPGVSNMSLNYMISIQQLDVNLVNELASSQGIIPTVGKIPMIVGV
jgi:hypothetical protein